jgi:hypothetical protein
VLDAAERGIIEIVVSAIALVEVLARNRTSGIDDQRVRDFFFDNDYILLVNVDKQLGGLCTTIDVGRSRTETARCHPSGNRVRRETLTNFIPSTTACWRSTACLTDWTARDWSLKSLPCQPHRHLYLTKSNEDEGRDNQRPRIQEVAGSDWPP